MALSTNSTRALARPPALECLPHLVQACHILDDWLIWGRVLCRHVEGDADELASTQYATPIRFLPGLGCALGEDGDDGSIKSGLQYLVGREEFVRETIRAWARYLSAAGNGSPLQTALLSWSPSAPPQPVILHTNSSDPTAHEAATAWLARFLLIGRRYLARVDFAELPGPGTAASEMDGVWQHLTWNDRDAALLAAAMRSERRRLHDRLFAANGAQDYEAVWNPRVLTEGELPALCQEVEARQSRWILLLLVDGPLKKDQIASARHQGTAGGDVKGKLRWLKSKGLIVADRPGRGSRGYSLTALGRCVLA
jgi:hypothetical protein